MSDGSFSELPIASVPKVMKSYYASVTDQFYDEDVFYIDYEQGRGDR